MRAMIVWLSLVALMQISLASTRTCDPSGQSQQARVEICYINPIIQVEGLPRLPECLETSEDLQVTTNLADPDKKPFLFYYSLDTLEPFMKASIDYEVKKLRSGCTGNVNWVVILNSHYMRDADAGKTFSFLICKNGEVATHTLSEELFSELETRRESISRGLPVSERNLFRFRLRIPMEAAAVFQRFPLAHPEFFVKLFELVKKDIFPVDQYIPFIHTKSHGSTKMSLTGLTEKSTDEKRQCQERTLNEHTPALRVQELMTQSEEGVGLGDIEEDLDEIYLGSSLGPRPVRDADSGSDHMGENQLGENQLGGHENQLGVHEGLGGPNGLGTHSGLLAESRFGLYHTSLGQVMGYLTRRSDYKSEIGFWMLESCESGISEKRSIADAQIGIQGMKAFYSASGSLWYRNLDWHHLLKEANGHAGTLQELVIRASSNIPNYIFKDVE